MRTPQRYDVLSLERLLVIDFENTCGPGVTPGTSDIIEVGAYQWIRGEEIDRARAISIKVRPTRSEVNKFCTHLTGIYPHELEGLPIFEQRAPLIQALATDFGAQAWVSWGQDQNLLHKQCVGAGVENPFEGLPHFDIKRLLTSMVYEVSGGQRPKGSSDGVGLKTALKELGLDFQGRQHSGSDDALNTAILLQTLRNGAQEKDLRAPVGQATRRPRIPLPRRAGSPEGCPKA
ncbi:3'-5' exonuclease [Paucibacter soli]|uniref:3'-5' exonuclease n=1 Tax=Paucibacter soli TaxID=3133433 RepID=UPI0030AAED5B